MSENFLAAPNTVPNDFCDLVMTCLAPGEASGARSGKPPPGSGPPVSGREPRYGGLANKNRRRTDRLDRLLTRNVLPRV